MKPIIAYLLISLFLLACQADDSTQLVTIDSKYTVMLPSFLEKAGTTLNDDASLQYMHGWKEFYVVVIDENKSDFESAIDNNQLSDRYSKDIDGYSKIMAEKFESSISASENNGWMPITIHNQPARIKTLRGSTEGVDAFYYIAIIEGKDHFYQVMTWTLAEKEKEFQNQMKAIIYSFKEL